MFKKIFIIYLILMFFILNCNSQDKKFSVREPILADKFYPGNKVLLQKEIKKYLQQNKKNTKKRPKALIIPHAGYIYSGPIAASGYSLIEGYNYKKVYIIGPSHYIRLPKASILNVKYYKTPLGKVALANEAKLLLKSGVFSTIVQAHEREHSVEIQIPFLQSVLSDFKIIPIVSGANNLSNSAKAIIKHYDNDSLIVVSSDLSHFHNYPKAKKIDRDCVNTILSLNPKDMSRKEACGRYPIIILLKIAKHFGWKPELIDLRNSGDTAGDKNRVVGYASIVFYDYKKKKEKRLNNPNLKDQKILLDLAKKVIRNRSVNIPINEDSLSDLLKAERGCFVTLNKNHRLRGCIGNILPYKSLYSAVISNAYSAAFRDPRFKPVIDSEIKDLDIEISVLTVPEELKFKNSDDLLNKLNPLKDGVIIQQNGRSATFLPQVWKQLPNKKEFLEHLCMKAGLSKDAWKNKGLKVQIYQAFVFK